MSAKDALERVREKLGPSTCVPDALPILEGSERVRVLAALERLHALVLDSDDAEVRIVGGSDRSPLAGRERARAVRQVRKEIREGQR